MKKQTRPKEFEHFINILMDPEQAPKGYKPWLLPCKKNGKDPDTKISWKAEKSRLTPAEAKRRLKNNWGNVGISGREEDQLILLDIDDPSIEHELKPTLKIRSRSRVGTHAIYWAHPEDDILPTNIPTNKGELRSSDQYVVAPGSHVPCTEQELDEKVDEGELDRQQKKKVLQDDDKGYYTLDNTQQISRIKFEELPQVFKEEYENRKRREKEVLDRETDFEPSQVESKETSALFELSISDLTGRGFTERDPHPLHASNTGSNWSISQGVGHCWRHEVSINALQFLCIEAGYLECHEAGTPHNGHGSEVIDNNKAIWEAWKHAKENGYIPEDDPIPTRAMKYIAQNHDCYEEDENGLLTTPSYNQVLDIVEEEY